MNNISSIDRLLLNGTDDEIKNNLLVEIYKISNYCDTVIGEGSFGKVILQSVGPYIKILIDDEKITIPVVIKESKYSKYSQFNIRKIKDNLIISCGEGMLCEALILYILSKDWYKGINIHMPLLVGMGSCSETNIGVSHLILEKCGLENRVNIKNNSFIGSPSSLAFEQSDSIQSFLTNAGGLIDYISFNLKHDLKCILPNGAEVYLPDFIDGMFIFYLHTTHFLWTKYKLTLGDQSTNNIFLHWINESSRCGKKKVNNLKYIYYQIDKNTYIKINTNGIIFKIGDVGISVMNPQNNVIIIGNSSNEENIDLISKFKEKTYSFWDFIFDSLRYIPLEVVIKTKIFKIIEKYSISTKYIPFVGTNVKYNNEMLSELEILNDEIYDSLKINHEQIIENENIFINSLF